MTADLQNARISGDTSLDISRIALHSGDAGPDSLFVAVCGNKADGHDFLEAAYQAGARAFVTQRPFCKENTATIIVPDTRRALGILASALYENPSRRMSLIGITGTNGKTSTAFLLSAILEAAGMPTGLLSTIQYRCLTQIVPAERTTPSQVETQRLLRTMADAGARCAVMEVSSHGLDQQRVDTCHFDVGIFTNLTPEHLDYHVTMDAYYESKKRFFTEVIPRSDKKETWAVINIDDPYGTELCRTLGRKTISFGLHEADVQAENTHLSISGISADIAAHGQRFHIRSPLIGTFNLYNILAAAAAAMAMKISTTAIQTGIEHTSGVPGRMERIENDRGFNVFVDYAHTGDALENVLKTLQQAGAQQIITIFGCGGDRDRTKRPVMGRIAAQYSSILILTSDNPRSENPAAIINEIEQGVIAQGFRRCNSAHTTRTQQDRMYHVDHDRRRAIRQGISMAGNESVVLIAGKGHEDYQEAHGSRVHFDDREEAREALRMCA
ncbi:MAG: UDP-N-acetylmuramoyl-L-alanyl-D-glutamate--2,6-diaminopimelate ligase [Deltaproteobacteria bacterium]|nr:UDP-N-acetylmuramoyl-L-alanyl-D-glutamate--2,6-diaminopimelate ligase [Deltaproteobacteria bacterium]